MRTSAAGSRMSQNLQWMRISEHPYIALALAMSSKNRRGNQLRHK